MHRSDSGYTGQKMLNMELPSRRKKERPLRRIMDAVKTHFRILKLPSPHTFSKMTFKETVIQYM